MAKQLPSQSRLAELFEYNQHTGFLVWRTHRGNQIPGSVAGSRNYTIKRTPANIAVGVDGRVYNASRLIWVMVHGNGSIPVGHEIDHINRNPFDNRLDNLRIATKQQNTQNRIRSNNSGHKGIYYTPEGRWMARLWIGGKNVNLGTFTDVSDAVAAYASASEMVHGEFAPLSLRTSLRTTST